MTDTFSVTVTFDKLTYNAGDLMTLAASGTIISGGSSKTAQIATSVQASDGSTFSTPLASATVVTAVPGASLTYGLKAITDISGRVWTISADGKSATATA